MPAASENGMAVRTIPVEGHDAAGVHPFQICAGGRALGVCTVRMDTVGQSALLEVFYIDPEVRRKHLGKSAMQRLAAFLRLAGTTELQAVISVNNWRAARFVEACGFRAGEQATSSAGSTSWVLRL